MNNSVFPTSQIRESIFSLVKEKDILLINKNRIDSYVEWSESSPIDIENIWYDGSTITIEFSQGEKETEDGYYEGWIEYYELLVEKDFLSIFLKKFFRDKNINKITND
jgi:hypothetical protein